MTINLYFYWTE